MPRGKTNNRTDLNLPKTVVPGQQYGSETAQLQDQDAIPMASSPAVTSTPDTTAPAAPVSTQVQAPFSAPGTLPYMHPTNRPNEPVTAGMNFGPGPGSEALRAPRPTLADNLDQYAGQSSTVDDLAATARLMGL